ncbi:LysR family transcriptional regulator [Pandoraea nosoerga]|uniref:Transcriptional regulator n=1 Tax=Pandoraea nosoerga TaxID=2508296 RepID=A0A5E4UBC7_9BURK|nr:LysR family transcriptional regulator [Pandoraea nosoerga]MBN4667604.1 LysR family transcriptional regulator [Pandoraea nosoerga]MBN4676724.1 LysR family transcriptional regulator [Pandoraea nosoerga]MBN4683253.1 LysR family transcriptional regulator [Pandoraea nosoerga]MBN4746716.1 LysR family transcriptional regulator [Pandoraea nosoerga]VVD95509.1 transcriptional regulator [Pandoraea nosoerga]
MHQLDAMRIFVRVTETGSFTQAADSLGLPRASVSNAIKQLETKLGTRLLHRTTRRVQLTQDGQACLERCQDLLADMEEWETMFVASDEALTGRLRVDLPATLARTTVIPQLPAFLAQHPALRVELSSTDRRVDLVREGFDCVLRVGAIGDSTLIARPLGRMRQINVASPAYLERYGVPQTLEDLSAHRLVYYTTTLGTRPAGWEYFDGERYAQWPMEGVLTVNNADAYQAACLAGLGLIQAPESGVRGHLAEGTLREVLPQYQAEPLAVTLLYANRRHLPRRVQAFMNWLADLLTPRLTAT